MKRNKAKAGRASEEKLPSDVSRQKGWRPARHRVDAAQTKLPTRRVTINLDEDIIAIFKAEALRGGPPYQVAINQALRRYLCEREQSSQEIAAQTVLKALDEREVINKLRKLIRETAA